MDQGQSLGGCLTIQDNYLMCGHLLPPFEICVTTMPLSCFVVYTHSFSLRISLWWSTLSKALEKSITATSVCLPLAMLSKFLRWMFFFVLLVIVFHNWVLIWNRAEVDIINYDCLGGSLWKKQLYVYWECMWGRLVCKFSGFDFAPFLNTGVAIASLQSVGTVPVLTDDWNKSDIVGWNLVWTDCFGWI